MNNLNISNKAIEHADACRFCWMCHHICPVGNATGQERNTARARGLAISMIARGGLELTQDIVDNMYECCLCGGCTNVCVTGWDPVMFTKQVRNYAALNGLLPKYIDKMLDNFDKCGNIYGVSDVDDELKNAVSSLEDSKTLLYLGADAKCKAPKNAVTAIELLKKAGVDFTVLTDEPDSGYSFDVILGAAAETKAVMENCAKTLNNYDTVITFDPNDAKIFTREYKEYGVELNAKLVTFTSICMELVKNGSINPTKCDCKVALQDNALLARELNETECGREIISAGANLCDMLNCKKDTMFAGSLLMGEYMPDVMLKLAKNRWIDAVNCGADALVTESVSEYVMLSKTKPENMKLFSIEQFLSK